jgi:hypothetical protein
MKRLLFFTILSMLLASPAWADIIGASANVNYSLTTPIDLTDDALQSNSVLYAIQEKQYYSLPSNVTLTSGFVSAPFSWYAGSSTSAMTLYAGTVINTTILHFDSATEHETSAYAEITGYITFANPIIGVIVTSYGLDNTNTALGISGITYNSNSNHGLESPDHVWVDASNLYKLNFYLKSWGLSNEIRVVTTPVPGAFLLGLLGFGVAGLKLRKYA